MNIAWYLGFGWKLIVPAVVFGIASYYFREGWIYWTCYILFVIIVICMLTRLRVYVRQPWRRLHHKSVMIISDIVKKDEFSGETVEDRTIQICQKLASLLLKPQDYVEFRERQLLTDGERKRYYKQLAENYPAVFFKNIQREKHDEAFKDLCKDIEASVLDPKVVTAYAVEKKYGGWEAARYFFAIASGYVK